VAEFAHIHGLAPGVGPGGYLVGANLDACLYVSSSFSDQLQKTVLNLHMPGGVIIQIEDETYIRDTLEKMGLGDVSWVLDLETIESRDD